MGFYGPIAPPVPNAPSSECPQFADLWSGSAEWCGRNISGSAHRRLPLSARCCTLQLVLHSASSERIPFDRREVAGMANFKMYLLRQFCSNRVDFLQYTGDTDAKKNGPEFSNSNSVIFENFLKFSDAAGAAKNVEFFVCLFCLSVRHAFERQRLCAWFRHEGVGVQKQFWYRWIGEDL